MTISSVTSGDTITATKVNEIITAVNTAASGSAGSGQMIGNATVKAISFNSQTISEDLTVAAGTNGWAAGPVTIANGFTVTVSDGSVLTIV